MSRSSTVAERGRLAAAVAALVAAALCLPAQAQSRRERIESLEERMDLVERQLENQALLEMARQLEALQAEIRRLNGEIERLGHELAQARRQQRDQYLDLDGRLKKAEEAAAAAAAAAAGPAADPAGAYQLAFDALKEARYDEAQARLQDFLAAHGDHELAPNAQYWLGEVHYVRRDYPAALAAFEKVLGDWPGSAKRPDALLKVGYCQQELGRTALARATLERLLREHPDSPAAAEATARLRRLGGG